MIKNFHGNQRVVSALERMVEQDRLPQTLLLAGPQGVGKATLARRLAAALVGETAKIEQDDLSLPHNLSLIADREKWSSEKRAEEPLYFGNHPDFLTFPPEGPLRQISIQQMRLLKEFAQFKPVRGARRIFLIDHLDRANDQAANSLLKTLEEPPEHLVLVLTVENPQDLLPTIRSRSVSFVLSPLSDPEMQAFFSERSVDHTERRMRLANGCPGLAISLDLEEYDRRAAAMLQLLKAASGLSPYHAWLQHSEGVASAREDKLDAYLSILYSLLSDVLHLQQDSGMVRNTELERDLRSVANNTTFEWIKTAISRVDEVLNLLRRNIQKSIALDALVLSLRRIQ